MYSRSRKSSWRCLGVSASSEPWLQPPRSILNKPTRKLLRSPFASCVSSHPSSFSMSSSAGHQASEPPFVPTSAPSPPDDQTDQGLDPDANEDDEEPESLSDELIRHWTNERFAPEVLHHQQDLLERALTRIHQQSTALDVLLSNPEELSGNDHFRLMLIETEVEQMRFVCKAYVRCRMYKLDKYFDHCLMEPEARSRLSPVDLEYCKRHQTLVHNLLYDLVLEQLPPKYQKLDEDHMIVRPDLDQGVFILARTDCGPVYLPNSESIFLQKGSRHFLRYRSIKPFLETHEVQLI
ncbi:hypothetical protein O181_040873 [Austropuccinia psidii MF-1]|uniref:DNA replication complex GINS protein SLD5 n=1 Tax=Austropuccinia psidii MF-1 TaxID=1389203 RepID=A0A9Q3HDA8_9BASI|nr:hypothetical protein [Austropuccinia psidii MF-1]